MKIDKWCDFDDCPNHPDYVEVEKKEIKEEPELAHIDMSQSHDHTIYSVGSTGFSNSYAATSSWTNMQSTGISPTSIEWGEDIKLASLDSGITLSTENISIPLECFTCSFMEKVNMKKTLVVNKAKKILQGEE